MAEIIQFEDLAPWQLLRQDKGVLLHAMAQKDDPGCQMLVDWLCEYTAELMEGRPPPPMSRVTFRKMVREAIAAAKPYQLELFEATQDLGEKGRAARQRR